MSNTRHTRHKTRLTVRFADYDAYHRHPANKLTHAVGVPLILVTLLGLLSQIPIGASELGAGDLFRSDAGAWLVVLAAPWYLWQDWRFASPYLLVVAGCYFIGRAIPIPGLWVLFVLGWIAQLIGHYVYEKKSPAFLKNIEQLLVGPAWIFARAIGYW